MTLSEFLEYVPFVRMFVRHRPVQAVVNLTTKPVEEMVTVDQSREKPVACPWCGNGLFVYLLHIAFAITGNASIQCNHFSPAH